MIYRIGWITLAILAVIAVTALFIPKIKEYRELNRKIELSQEEIRLEEEMVKHLKEQQDRLRSDPRFVEKIAREEFGYAKPGETVFRFTDDEVPSSNRSSP